MRGNSVNRVYPLLLGGEGFTCLGGTWEATYGVQSNNGKGGECWRLGFSGPRVTELLDLIACFVSVVTLYKQTQYGTWGYRTGHNQLPPASVCM